MKKFVCMFVLLILFFSSFGSTYFYLYEKHHSMSVLGNKIDKVVEEIKDETSKDNSNKDVPNKEDVNKAKDGDNAEAKPVDSNKVQDRPLFSKEVFLTFDDGPSINTPKILKILDDNKIKATFFVIGSNVDAHQDLVKAEHDHGMTVLNHSFSHSYSMYKSVEACIEDFNRCNVSIKNAIGIQPINYIRFPGGSDNKVSNSKVMNDIRNKFAADGKEFVDWNVDSGDADKVKVAASVITHNLLRQLANKNFAVALMHDAPAKTTTVEALPAVIDYLKKQGFIFRTFDDLTPTEEKEMIKDRLIDKDTNRLQTFKTDTNSDIYLI